MVTQEPVMRVRIDDGGFLPIRFHDTDAGADIFCPAGFTLSARSSAVIRTRVHVELPPFTVGLLKSKSGLNIKHDIVGEGVIDQGFTGEVIVKLYNLGDRPHHFEAKDKIIQLLVVPVLYPRIERVDQIAGGERGDAGYGSTGR